MFVVLSILGWRSYYLALVYLSHTYTSLCDRAGFRLGVAERVWCDGGSVESNESREGEGGLDLVVCGG